MLVAEADGNRTRQTEILGLTGFEDRGTHQDTDASATEIITAAVSNRLLGKHALRPLDWKP